MEIDRKTIKALSADSRLDIMKSLASRRKMPSELSVSLKLSPSTVSEHLKVLEESGLVKRVDTGHKWIYYELTGKGGELARPRNPVQFMIVIAAGALIMILGFFRDTASLMLSAPTMMGEASSMNTAVKSTAPAAAQSASYQPDLISAVLVAFGMLLIAAAALAMAKNIKT